MAPQDAKHCASWQMTLKQHNAGVHCNKKTPPMASNYAFHFHLALNFRLCTSKNAPASGGLRPPAPLLGLRPWTPLLNRWIKHSQQTMNQDNKISSVRPGTINIELGPDLYVLLYYRGLRSVDDIYRVQSAYTENYCEPSPVCTAIKNDINCIKLCI